MPIRLYKIASFQDETLKDFNQRMILSISYSRDGFSFAVYHPERNKFLALDALRVNNLNKNLYGETYHRHLQAALSVEYENGLFPEFHEQKTCVNMMANQATLVPLSLFDETQVEAYLTLNYPQLQGSVRYEINNAINAVCVYSVYDSAVEFFEKQWANLEIHPMQNTLLTQLQRINKNGLEETAVYCYVEASQFVVTAFKEGKLFFFNTFCYQSSRDFAFYILSVYENLGFNPDVVPLIFSGDIFNDAEIWQTLWKYIRYIRYLKGSDPFSFSYQFDHAPTHQFFHLFNAVSCVLLEGYGKREE